MPPIQINNGYFSNRPTYSKKRILFNNHRLNPLFMILLHLTIVLTGKKWNSVVNFNYTQSPPMCTTRNKLWVRFDWL